MRVPQGLSPLADRNFALFWVGSGVTRLGRAIEDIGAFWLMYELTHSPVLVGLLGLAGAIPSFIAAPIAGVVADRVDQRKLLMTTQSLGLMASLALAILVVTGIVQPWHIYVEVAVQSVILAFDWAVRQALFPRLVPRSELSNAVTLLVTAARTSQLVGPVVGGLVIASWGEASPFFLNASSFPVLIAGVGLMRGVDPGIGHARSRFRTELTEGLRYVVRAPVLSGLLKLEVAFSLFQLNTAIITIIGRQVLGVGPEGLGGLLAAPAVGSLIGISILLVKGHTRRQGRFVLVCALAYAAPLAVFGLSHNYLLSLAMLAVGGAVDAVMMVTRTSVMQLAAPAQMRGRVMASMGTITLGVGPLAQAQSGLLAGLFGPAYAPVIAATALALAAAATARTNSALWRFSRDEGAVQSGDAAPPSASG